MKTGIYFLIQILLFSIGFANANAQLLVDVETGLVTTGYNNVKIPGNEGTLFSLKNDFTSNTKFYYRARLSYTIKSRSTISVLYAPLLVKYTGVTKFPIIFAGTTFAANTNLIGIYKFNSYRLTYRYDIVQKPKLNFGLGLTAKIRDAQIALTSTTLQSAKKNVGFIPIINFKVAWNANNKITLLLEGDALAAPQGRAEDVLLAVNYNLTKNFKIRAGYRILEGGASNDEVYNFSLFHYASFGLLYQLSKK